MYLHYGCWSAVGRPISTKYGPIAPHVQVEQHNTIMNFCFQGNEWKNLMAGSLMLQPLPAFFTRVVITKDEYMNSDKDNQLATLAQNDKSLRVFKRCYEYLDSMVVLFYGSTLSLIENYFLR